MHHRERRYHSVEYNDYIVLPREFVQDSDDSMISMSLKCRRGRRFSLP
jgi:hypothetical protein